MKNQLLILLMVQLYIAPCLSQSFSFHSNSPFGIQVVKEDSTRAAQQIMFFDYDKDEDLDLLIVGLDYFDDADPIEWENIHYFIELQENTGDKWNPQFADRSTVFENFPFPLGYFFPAAGDLDDDGTVDFIINAIVNFFGGRTPIYASNNGSNEFDVTRLDSMGLINFLPESFYVPELIDLDTDGDLDLLMSGFDPAFAEENGPDIPNYYYAKNIGSAKQPELLGWFSNPYGLIPNPYVELLIGGDIDNDGDMDLLGTTTVIPPDSMNHFYVHLNTPGFDDKPSFGPALLSPFGLPSNFGEEQYIFPELVDIDSDGDLDLFVFLSGPDDLLLQYYENTLCNTEMSELTVALCEGDAYKLGGNTYSAAGNYTVVLQGSDGCDSIVNLTIEFIPPVDIFVSESICDGESFVIGGETFTQAGDYTVFIMGANGCDSIINLSLDVQLVDNAVDVNENTLTVVLSGATYQWINCDSGENIPGATGQVFVATVSGNYAVSITNSLGCSNISECINVLISSISGIDLASSITLYPNPNHGIIYVKNNTTLQLSSVTVTNADGKILDTFLFDDNQSIDISSLGKGFFILRIKTNGTDIVKRLIIL